MLNYKTIMIMNIKPDEKAVISNGQTKPAGLKAVKKVTKVLTGPMITRDIVKISGLSQSTTSLVVRDMRKAGDLTTIGITHTPTGSSNLLNKLQAKPHRSNVGVTGVSFNAKTKRFSCSFKRGYAPTFKTLLDAVCHRKSLELGVEQC